MSQLSFIKKNKSQEEQAYDGDVSVLKFRNKKSEDALDDVPPQQKNTMKSEDAFDAIWSTCHPIYHLFTALFVGFFLRKWLFIDRGVYEGDNVPSVLEEN